MNQKIILVTLSLLVMLSVGWVWQMSSQQRTQKIPTTPSPALKAVPAKDDDTTGKTVAAAKALLATLDDSGRTKMSFAFDDDAQKRQWSNFPTGIFKRNGLRMGDISPVQREAVMKLLAVALSKQGLQKVKDIMEGDEALSKNGGGRGPGGGPPNGGPPPGGGRGPGGGPGGRRLMFSRDEYYLAFLGAPSLTEPWMIQFGGHHLAINVTVVGKANVLTPSLPCTQPGTYQLNGETIRPLGRELDKGSVLINSLDAAQQKQAILPYQMGDLVLGAGEDGKTIQPEGIKVSALNKAQQEKLWDVVYEWVGILNEEAATAKMNEIKANAKDTWLAWSGATTAGSGAYYRIQGPTLLIEFSPQRGDTEHIHTIYRDPTNDYGVRLIKK